MARSLRTRSPDSSSKECARTPRDRSASTPQNIAPPAVALGVSCLVMSFQTGPQASLFAELFPPEVRRSGASLGYRAAAILGGMAPMAMVALVNGGGRQPLAGSLPHIQGVDRDAAVRGVRRPVGHQVIETAADQAEWLRPEAMSRTVPFSPPRATQRRSSHTIATMMI